MQENMETKLLEALGFRIESYQDKYVLKNKKNLVVGTVKDDLEKKERIYEFTTINKKGKQVTICLKLGDTIRLGFMNEDGKVRSFSISNDALELIMPFSDNNKKGHEHILIKGNDNTSLNCYLGTNYVYQAEYYLDNDKTNDIKTTYFDYQTSPESNYDLKLNYKFFDGLTGEEHILKTPIRRIIASDKEGISTFTRFREYANEILGLPFDIMQLLMTKNISRNDVFTTYIEDLKTNSRIPDFDEIKELDSNILFGIVYERNGIDRRAHATIVYNLDECYDFGYLDDLKSSYVFDRQYIFKLNKKREVERVFDLENKIEVESPEEKKQLYKEFTCVKYLKY